MLLINAIGATLFSEIFSWPEQEEVTSDRKIKKDNGFMTDVKNGLRLDPDYMINTIETTNK
jgi:hypothetical protein